MALLSKGKLSKMMLDILLEFPSGAKNLKDNVTLRLGMIGQHFQGSTSTFFYAQ